MQVPKKLEELLDTLTYDERVWWFSLTIPTSLSSEELLRQLRSQVPQMLEEKGLHSRVKQQLRSVINTVHSTIRETISNSESKGVFVAVRANLDLLSNARKDSINELLDFHTFSLVSTPQTKVLLSPIPDLTYAIEHFSSKDSHLLLAIDPQESHLYKILKDHRTSKIWHHTNKFIKPEHNRYYQKVTVTQNQSIRHGTGAEKVTRVLNSGEKLFVSDELKKLSKNFNCKTLTILVSQKYATWQSEIEKEARELFPNINQELQVQSSDSFDSLDKKDITAFGIGQASEEVEIPTSSNPNTISKLHSISKALRKGRVDTLYLRPSISYGAFVHPNADSFTYPVKDSKKVDSIRPWLIKSAIESSAKVAIVSDTDKMQQSVIATTRY